MAKYVATPIGSGFQSQANLNQNFEEIEDNFQRVLYRDGSTPNQMESNIDMNGYTIYNAGSVSADSMTINGQPVVANQTFVTELPDPVGQAGKFVRSDGAAASWQPIRDTDVTLTGEISIPVNTVAEMVALTNLVDGAIVRTASFGALGDGGAENYQYFSIPPGTADGLIYHDQTVGGGQFKLIHSGTFKASAASGATEADKISTAIAAIKSSNNGKGVLIIPGDFSSATVVPPLNLSNNQSIAIVDLRTDRPSPPFGAIEVYVEGRDSGGGYASEFNVKGKQNPAFVANSVSDGTASGYPIANKASSFLHRANGSAVVQHLTDPLFRGYFDHSQIQYSSGSATLSYIAGIDGNFKTRFDYAPSNFASSAISISSVTDTTPIVINTATPHGMVATRSYIAVAGVGTGVNGSWVALNTGASQLTLLNSVASGAFGAGGTVTVFPNRQRATVNVPAVQGGTEAIFSEGVIASGVTQASGNAPIKVVSQVADVNLHAKPYVVNINGVQQVSGTPGTGTAKIVIGNISLSAGTATVNLTGAAQFTSTGSYKVVATDITVANAVRVNRVNGAQFTLTGTGTDSIDFIAIGF